MKRQNSESRNLGGQPVQKDWLLEASKQGFDNYRSWLHASLLKAESEYKLRKLKQGGISLDSQESQKLKEKISELSKQLPSLIMPQSRQTYLNEEPKIPNFGKERLMLSKIGRNCFHKPLDRYFEIDTQNQQILQFKEQNQERTDKIYTLLECTVIIEKIEDYSGDEKLAKLWTHESPLRISIKLRSRKFQPIYYYCANIHEAKCNKYFVESLLRQPTSNELAYLNMAHTIYSVRIYSCVLGRMLDLRRRIFQINKLHLSLFVINQDFKLQFQEKAIQWDQMCVLQNYDSDKEDSPIKIDNPKIWSTFREGLCKKPKVKDFKSKLIKSKFLLFRKMRNKQRNEIVSDMIKSKGSIGNVPYAYNDITGDKIKIVGENLKIVDKKKNEFSIPLNEICFMATDYDINSRPKPKNSYTLVLNGRKFNQEIETKLEKSELPIHMSYERIKHSRLSQKSIVTFSLKKLTIPMQSRVKIQNTLKPYEKAVLKLKFTAGNFYCYSQALSVKEIINLNDEEIPIDINQAQFIQISLSFFKYDKGAHKLANIFVNDEILGSINLRTKDFKNQENQQLLHELSFNNAIYNPQVQENQANNIHLQTAIAITEVNGAEQTAEMEGNQLLIGRSVLYKGIYPAKVYKISGSNTCQIQLHKPMEDSNDLLIENVQIQQDITLIERYGISILDLDDLPPKYQNGLYEWTLKFFFNQQDHESIIKLQQAIQNQQVKSLLNWRSEGSKRKYKNKLFICGTLSLAILDAQNLMNTKSDLCNTYMQVSVRDTVNQMKSKFIDIANEQSFIQCIQNSEKLMDKNFKTSTIPLNNNPSWVKKDNPNGEIFDLGMILATFPHYILIEVYHANKDGDDELLGHVEFDSSELISVEEVGKEFYMFLEDCKSVNSIIKVQTLFTPSRGTIERLGLESQNCVFKTAQQFLFYKVLNMSEAFDEYGYKVPIGLYNPQLEFNKRDISKEAQTKQEELMKRYENFSPKHTKQVNLKNENSLRPKFEENQYIFQKLWMYTQFLSRNTALTKRMCVLWERYMTILMKDINDNADLADDMKSMKSRWTNTTKMISSIHRKRARQNQSTTQSQKEALTTTKGQKFSVIFAGQWEKEQSWKYIDIWYLIKYGIPSEMRLTIWSDLLRKQIHEGMEEKYFKTSNKYKMLYNRNISAYANMKNLANDRDSQFYKLLEEDIKNFKFPQNYQKKSEHLRQDKLEEERLSLYQIMKVYDFWATEYYQRKSKVLFYNRGMLAIVQRFLTIMAEEEVFWMLIGIVKSFNKFWIFDFDPEINTANPTSIEEQKNEQLLYQYSPFVTRRVGYRIEMYIIKSCIKLYHPQVFQKFIALGMPIEWYFYDEFSTFFAYTFSSEIVLRLWDMVIFNLSTSQLQDRKRALWYLLAVPMYMIQVNEELILKANTPEEVKKLLIHRTAAINFNPDHFIEDLLEVIKKQFVKKQGMESWFGDKTKALEQIRQEVEDYILNNFIEERNKNKEIIKYDLKASASVDLNPKLQVQDQPQTYTLKLAVQSFRNLFSMEEAGDDIQLSVQFQGNETFQTTQIKVQVPETVEGQKYYKVKNPPVTTQKLNQLINPLLQVKLIETRNGIHQNLRGKGVLDLSLFTTQHQLLHFHTIKLHGAQESPNSYIDISILMINNTMRNQVWSFIEGTKDEDYDCFLQYEDFQFRKNLTISYQNLLLNSSKPSLAESQIAQNYNRQLCYFEEEIRKISKDYQTQEMDDFIRQIGHNNLSIILQQTNLKDDVQKNFGKIFLKLLLILNKKNMLQLENDIFRLFSSKLAMSQNDFSRLVHHLYNMMFYKIPYNQINTMISQEIKKGSQPVLILQAIQRTYILQNDSESTFSFLMPKVDLSFSNNVTEELQDTVNRVIRTTGIIHSIDFNTQPFNNINFLLKNNQIKRQAQLLEVTVQDCYGDRLIFEFVFNSQGLFVNSHSQTLPLQLGGSRQVTQTEFHNVMDKLPLVSDLLRFNQFLNCQRLNDQEALTETSQPYQVLFRTVNATFLIKFYDRIEKQNDFTIDDTQYNRLVKEDVSKIYTKDQSQGLMIDIKLSPLHEQDTCLRLKQRVKLVIDYIVMSENLSDIPSVLSEKYQLKEQNSNKIFNTFDRFIQQSNHKHFELVRVQDQEINTVNEYQNYGLYEHSDGVKQWRKCKINHRSINQIKKIETYQVEYEHEKGNIYLLSRKDILLSFEFKKTFDPHYKEEVKDFLQQLDKDAALIAMSLQAQDNKQFQQVKEFADPKKKQIIDEGLSIKDMDMAINEEEDEESVNSDS